MEIKYVLYNGSKQGKFLKYTFRHNNKQYV